MRVLVLALMIALLPLRGWVGDAMAIGSANPPGHAVVTATMPDCPGHDGAQEAATESQGVAHATEDCADCSSCQICHTVALAAPLPLAADAALPWATPQATLSRHASAERAPGFKPPIS